jgi:ABC-type proline/glycine betaine transport system permease subunit
VARGAAAAVMGQEFIEAGRAVGVSDFTLMWRYLTLNCISTIFVFLSLRFGQIILIGSALSFLGMGAQPPTAELGMMAAQGRDFLFMAPHIATIPSLAIFVIVLAANLLGDALRDVLDPPCSSNAAPTAMTPTGIGRGGPRCGNRRALLAAFGLAAYGPQTGAQTLNMMKGIDAPHYDGQRTTWGRPPTSST